MFFLVAMFFSSVASFLFPVFASYKALKTSDPAQLTPWLMYWVVLACYLLAESWLSFILSWVPFYTYIRLLFLLYLVLPQTQGARVIYQDHVHLFLQEHETNIDDFITRTHERLKLAGLAYFRRAVDYVKTNLLGLPASDPVAPASTTEPSAPQSYTKALLARFNVPAARWTGSAAGNAAGDFFNLLAGTVSAAATTGTARRPSGSGDPTAAGNLIPPGLREPGEKLNFINAQRDRLNIVLSALNHEAQQIQHDDTARRRAPFTSGEGTTLMDAEESTPRPSSGLSMWSGLSKSRSEADFEKIDAESGAEDEITLRRRGVSSGSSWVPWAWTGSKDTGGSRADGTTNKED